MTSQTNEIDSAAYVAAAPSSAADTMPTLAAPDVSTQDDASPADHINMDVTVDNPVSNHDLTPDMVSVYASTITPVSYEPGSTVAAFDVIFSVSCTDSKGTVSTHQVVKRIGVDKMKMANDAKMTTPISIVEAQQPLINATKERFRALAGLK